MAEEDQPIVGKGTEVRKIAGMELDPKVFSDSIALSIHSVSGLTPSASAAATAVVA